MTKQTACLPQPIVDADWIARHTMNDIYRAQKRQLAWLATAQFYHRVAQLWEEEAPELDRVWFEPQQDRVATWLQLESVKSGRHEALLKASSPAVRKFFKDLSSLRVALMLSNEEMKSAITLSVPAWRYGVWITREDMRAVADYVLAHPGTTQVDGDRARDWARAQALDQALPAMGSAARPRL